MQSVTDSPASRNLIARYATYAGLPGYAIRTADRRVYFVDQDAQLTELHNADISALVLLGNVNTAEKQNLANRLAGGYATVACSREFWRS